MKIKKDLHNILLVCISSIVAISIAEFYIHKNQKLFFPPCKKYISNTIHCYPSPPKGLSTINLNSLEGQKLIASNIHFQSFTNSKLEKLKIRTPYCQTHDIAKKQQGKFPERKESIFIVGDSFTFGEGVDEHQTLASLLSVKNKLYNFRNFGYSKNSIYHIYQWIQLLSQKINATKFLYFYNLNDILMTPDTQKKQNKIIDFQKVEIGCEEEIRFPRLIELIKRTYKLHRKTSETIQNYNEMYFGDLNKEALRHSIAYLKAINDLVISIDGKFILIIYPLIYKDSLGDYPFKNIHLKILNICEDLQITCIDGLEPFNDFYSMKQFRAHKIDYHPNAKANNIMIDYLIKNKIFQQL